jgi:hypothetical protein
MLEYEEMFEYGVYVYTRFTWEYNPYNRGEAPDTDDILEEILTDINAEECLRMEAEFK